MGPLFWAMAGKARRGQCAVRRHTGGGGYSPLVCWVSLTILILGVVSELSYICVFGVVEVWVVIVGQLLGTPLALRRPTI